MELAGKQLEIMAEQQQKGAEFVNKEVRVSCLIPSRKSPTTKQLIDHSDRAEFRQKKADPRSADSTPLKKCVF